MNYESDTVITVENNSCNQKVLIWEQKVTNVC